MLIKRKYNEMFVVFNKSSRRFYYFMDVAYVIAAGYFGGLPLSDIIGQVQKEYGCSNADAIKIDCTIFYNQLAVLFGDKATLSSQRSVVSSQCNEIDISVTAETDILDYACREIIPFSATIELTDKCNLNCIHCYCEGSGVTLWDYPRLVKLVDELYDMGTMDLEITGGECFSHPDIIPFLSYANDMGFIITLLTNATLVTPETADFIASLMPRNVQVSLYSLDSHIHDNITTVSGSLRQSLSGIKLLAKRGVTVSIATPILDMNADHVGTLNEWANRNGYEINYSYKISPSRDSAKNPEEHSVILRNRGTLLPDIFAKTEFNTKLRKVLTKPSRVHMDDKHLCQAGFRNICIDFKGNIHPCNSIRFPFGNIFECSLIDIWKGEKAEQWRKVTIDDYPHCATCEARQYCEPCPADYFTRTGSIAHIDEQSCLYGKAIYKFVKEHSDGKM